MAPEVDRNIGVLKTSVPVSARRILLWMVGKDSHESKGLDLLRLRGSRVCTVTVAPLASTRLRVGVVADMKR